MVEEVYAVGCVRLCEFFQYTGIFYLFVQNSEVEWDVYAQSERPGKIDNSALVGMFVSRPYNFSVRRLC